MDVVEIDELWGDGGAQSGDSAETGRREREQGEIRRALGVDDASGYHVVRRRRPDETPAIACDDSTFVPQAPARLPGAEHHAGVATAATERVFPCLDGRRYTGCLGMACGLEICWTGGMTVRFAATLRKRAPISTALYLPGAPCHSCACLAEDTAPAPPRPATRRGAPAGMEATGMSEEETTGVSEEETTRVSEEETTGVSEEEAVGEQAGARDPATLRRIVCTRGLWAHPISLASFVTKRIPMLDQEAPAQCPGHVARHAPHPAVAEHLRKRRERTRRQREERRVVDDE